MYSYLLDLYAVLYLLVDRIQWLCFLIISNWLSYTLFCFSPNGVAFHMCMFCFHCGISNLHTLVLFLSCMINCLRSLLRKCMRNWESYFRLLFSLLLPLAWVLQAFFVHDDKWLQWRIVTTIIWRNYASLRLDSVWNYWKDQRMYI